MIKGLTLVQQVPSPESFERLSRLLASLGFEPGKGWETTGGRGSAFLAPLANLELVTGRAPAVPALLIEVTGLDQVYAAVRDWLATEPTRGGASLPSSDENPAPLVLDEPAGKLISTSGATASDPVSVPAEVEDPRESRLNPDKKLSEVVATHWNSRLFSVSLVPELEVGFWESEDPQHSRPIALEGDLSAAGMRFAIVVARWNSVITERLLQGSLDALMRSGGRREAIEIVRVPGAWEIPSAARTLGESRRFSAIVTLGVLLRGETAHYEAIYTEVARGIGQSQQETGIPHSFGVLTCETLEQALDRAGLKAGNKGFEAASAAIEMASLQGKLATGQEPLAPAGARS